MKAAGVAYTVGRERRRRNMENRWPGGRSFCPGVTSSAFPCRHSTHRASRCPMCSRRTRWRNAAPAATNFSPIVSASVLTRNPANRLPIPKPEGYDAARFALVRRHLEALGKEAKLRDFLGISILPNDKTDINSGGPVSTDLLGASWEYPEASYERREQIWQEHLTWAQGLLWFLGNEPVVPESIRNEMQQWGLAKDEFPDTGQLATPVVCARGAADAGRVCAHAEGPPAVPAQV